MVVGERTKFRQPLKLFNPTSFALRKYKEQNLFVQHRNKSRDDFQCYVVLKFKFSRQNDIKTNSLATNTWSPHWTHLLRKSLARNRRVIHSNFSLEMLTNLKQRVGNNAGNNNWEKICRVVSPVPEGTWTPKQRFDGSTHLCETHSLSHTHTLRTLQNKKKLWLGAVLVCPSDCSRLDWTLALNDAAFSLSFLYTAPKQRLTLGLTAQPNAI